MLHFLNESSRQKKTDRIKTCFLCFSYFFMEITFSLLIFEQQNMCVAIKVVSETRVMLDSI